MNQLSEIAGVEKLPPALPSIEVLMDMDIFKLEGLYCQFFPDFEQYLFRLYKRRRMQGELGVMEMSGQVESLGQAFDKARIFFITNLCRDFSQYAWKQVRKNLSEKGFSERLAWDYYHKKDPHPKQVNDLANAAEIQLQGSNQCAFNYLLGARIAVFTQRTAGKPTKSFRFETSTEKSSAAKRSDKDGLIEALSTLNSAPVRSHISGRTERIPWHDTETVWRVQNDTQGFQQIPLQHVDIDNPTEAISFLKGAFGWQGSLKNGGIAIGANWPKGLQTDFIRTCAKVGVYAALGPKSVLISDISSLQRIIDLKIITPDRHSIVYAALVSHIKNSSEKRKTPSVTTYIEFRQRTAKGEELSSSQWEKDIGVHRDTILGWKKGLRLTPSMQTYEALIATPDQDWENRLTIAKTLRIARDVNQASSTPIDVSEADITDFIAGKEKLNQTETAVTWLDKLTISQAWQKLKQSIPNDPALAREFVVDEDALPYCPVVKTASQVSVYAKQFEAVIRWAVDRIYGEPQNNNRAPEQLHEIAQKTLEETLLILQPETLNESPWLLVVDEVRAAISEVHN